MTVRDTSRAAYWSLQYGKHITRAQAIVLDVLLNCGACTRKQIHYYSVLSLSCVCGRVKELLDLKLVQDDATVLDEESGKHVHIVKLVQP